MSIHRAHFVLQCAENCNRVVLEKKRDEDKQRMLDKRDEDKQRMLDYVY